MRRPDPNRIVLLIGGCMKRNPIEEAISEQLRGFVPVDNIQNGGKGYTRDQLFLPKRRTETILVEMVDKLRNWKDEDQQKPTAGLKRKRRRGPKVSSMRFF
jgi:hypothetical protein